MEGNLPPPQYTPDQKLFCVMSKNKGATTDQIRQEFSEKWPTKNPPTRKSIFNFEKQLNEKKNLADQRKGKSGRRFTVRTQENIQSVKHLLESEKDRKPDQPGSSCRRNMMNISKSSFNRIVLKDLSWRPYKIIRRQKISPANADMRLQMGRFLASKPKRYFENLIVSDEAWFTMGGHVMNRKNNVLYARCGQGVPQQWFTEAEQSHDKVMVFCLLAGGGEKFGPFFFKKDKTIDSHSYKWLLAHQVIPEIKQRLGMDRFNQAIWQQDGAKPHQAHIVMDWLDQVFGDRMLALKARQGMFWAPASPDMNPCDFFLWGHMKELVYRPMPANMLDLKRKITEVFNSISEETVRKAVFNMMSRAQKLVVEGGKGFEGKNIRI